MASSAAMPDAHDGGDHEGSLKEELAVKSSLVEALVAENEQLRNLLQRHADQAEVTETKRFSRGDMRRESNINELQAALAVMRSQLHTTSTDYEEQAKLVSTLQDQKKELETKLSDANDQIELLKGTVTDLQVKLAEEQASLEEERTRVATLRTGLDESKRAIVILQEQNERRQSEAAAARRASLEAQGILPITSSGGLGTGTTTSRRASLAFPNVSEARRGSLNYLNGLGLATKRTAYFDPAKMPSRHGSLADNSTMPSEHEVLARRRASLPASGLQDMLQANGEDSQSRNGMPTSASSPHLGGPVSKKPSMTATAAAARRSSIGYESSPTRRNSHLAHTLSRLAANGAENDLPVSRRGSRVLASDLSGLSSLPEHETGVHGGESVKTRRRSSLLVNPNHIRRPSDKPHPSVILRDIVDDPISKVRKIDELGDGDGLVHALSLEAVMEISALRETVEQLRLQLFESEEAREASETCSKVLREFIASQTTNTETPAPVIRLPPLPTEADELDTSSPNAKIKTDRSASDRPETRKTSSLWAIPRMLPSLTYGTAKKDQPASTNSASDSVTKAFNSISSDLLVPSRVADIKRRTSSISSRSEYSCNSGPVSPYLGFVNSGTFKPNFESFSFSAHRAQPGTPRLEPPSPLVGPTDTRFADSASSTGDSESEAELVTPCEAVFGEGVTDTPKLQERDVSTFEVDQMLVDPALATV